MIRPSNDGALGKRPYFHFFGGTGLIDDIAGFHQKFGLEPLDEPGFLSEDLMEFRVKFLLEEMEELIKAWKNSDLTETFDAIIDIVYVALGTAYLMRLPTKLGWEEVHASNMEKVRAKSPIDSKRGSSSDVVKPLGWKKPDLEYILKSTAYMLQQRTGGGNDAA